MPSHFKFKDYCPHVFRNLREQFGIDQNEYLVGVLCGELLELPVCSARSRTSSPSRTRS